MFHQTLTRPRAIAIAGALALLALAGPVAGNTPDRITESDTFVSCLAIPGESGVIRVTVALSSLGGPSGFLNYWADPANPTSDPPTLISDEVDVAIGPDGTITATFAMYLPGDLGLEGDPEPIFVGTAELSATVETIGEVEEIFQRAQNGNQRTVILGGRQAVVVTGGEVSVPTGGVIDLTGADCTGRRQVIEMITTMPNADVSTGHLIQVDCFFETESGFIVLSGQSGSTETFLGALIVDGSDVFFGEAIDPQVTLRGVSGTISLPMDGSPSVVAIADVSARFDVIERFKGRVDTETGWASETAYLLGVDGVLSIDGPAGAIVLPMESCSANAQIGISHSH